MENTSYDVLGSNDIGDLCDLAKTLTKPGDRGHAFCFSLQFSLRWQRLQYVTEEKEVVNGGGGEKVEIKVQEVFEVEQTSLFYTRSFRHYQ